MKYPKCEVCHKKESVSLSAFGIRRWGMDHHIPVEWKLACACTSDSEDYYIEFERFIGEEDWLQHMRSKIWFKDSPFLDCVNRAGLNSYVRNKEVSGGKERIQKAGER